MPELPEVETIARGLDKRVTGDEIDSVWIGSRKQPLKSTATEIAATLEGKKIVRVHRAGKHIVFDLEKGAARRKARRNEFAHDMNPLSFTSEKILPLCEKLPVPNILDDAEPVEPEDINERMRRRFIEMTYLQLLLLIGDLEG